MYSRVFMSNQNKVIIGFSTNEFNALVKTAEENVQKDKRTLRKMARRALHRKVNGVSSHDQIRSKVNKRWGVSDYHKSNGQEKSHKMQDLKAMIAGYEEQTMNDLRTEAQKDRRELLKTLQQAQKDLLFPVLAANNLVVITR